MLKLLPAVIGCLGLLATSVVADDTLKSQKQKAGYIIGLEIGQQLTPSKEDIDVDSLTAGLKDSLAGKTPKLTNEEMQTVMTAYQTTMQAKQKAIIDKLVSENKKASDAYLASNKTKSGVVTLESGLQYKVLKSGTGKVSPKTTDTVVTHYQGTLLDGNVFDSSYARGEPVTFPVNGVIKGWTEALMKMKVGDKWQLVVPAHLAYGDRGAPPTITPGATLLFDVELLEIK